MAVWQRVITAVPEQRTVAPDAIPALEQNCDGELWLSVCVAANVLGLVSTGLWFVVLVPQVAKNFWRRSVAGLSFLWALANFTASLVNLFFAFTIQLPLYSKVSAVYMPVLELTILLQFLLFHKLLLRRKLLFLGLCLLLWGAIVELELCLPYPAADNLEWIAIVLWSVETFPQVVLNAQLRGTQGQSTLSVLITICGKTTDFLSTYALDMPLKYVIMAYFSSSMGLANGWQLFWYGRRVWLEEGCCTCDGPCKHSRGQGAPSEARSKLNGVGNHMWVVAGGREHERSTVQTGSREGEEGSLVQTGSREGEEGSLVPSGSEECRQPLLNGLHNPMDPGTRHLQEVAVCKKVVITVACIAGLTYCAVGVCVFVVGLWWRSGSLWSLLAPAACVIVLLVTLLARHCKDKGWHHTSTNWWITCSTRVQTVLACV